MYRHIFVTFAFVILAFKLVGCAFEVPAPAETDVAAAGETGSLSIIPGNMSETTREPGTLRGVLMTARIRNTTAHPIEFSLPPTSFHGRLDTALSSTFRCVAYDDGNGTVLGTVDGELNAGAVDYVAYDEVVRLGPGDEMELVLRANILADADNSVVVGMGDAGQFLLDARFADTGEFVPMDRIRGNESIARHITIEQ
ncbi:hypothetical protein EDM68_01500 [Candidatus Uhrbacteria bacterium]|nr:MAG: hypothetical protein EDM68_01500 [Candidatus Uhrbacteria bacterium]